LPKEGEADIETSADGTLIHDSVTADDIAAVVSRVTGSKLIPKKSQAATNIQVLTIYSPNGETYFRTRREADSHGRYIARISSRSR
jgi:hypothetical protein